jgi:DNA polymerase-1
MKRGLVILYDTLTAKGWEFGREYAVMALVHDEWQASVKPELADEYGEVACEAIREAGRFYDFGCPLDAQFKKGRNWKDTH